MNAYNRAVLDQYCRETCQTPKQKRELVERLTREYGGKLDTHDLFTIGTKHLTVAGTLSPVAPEAS